MKIINDTADIESGGMSTLIPTGSTMSRVSKVIPSSGTDRVVTEDSSERKEAAGVHPLLICTWSTIR